MRRVCIIAVLIMSGWSVVAQETLATVTARGNVANTSLQIGGGYVNANTTKLFILNPLGKNFALSAGANMVHESGFHIYNWTDNPTMPLFSLSNEGNVGIGTHSPKAKLDVNGNILISNSLIPMGLMTENIGTTTPLLNMSVNFREANRVEAYLGAAFRIDPRGESLGAPLFQWIKHEPNSALEPILMNLTASGNLGLGILIPTEKLAVNGNIRAREIKVETDHWPDYVFQKDYKLPTLEETEQHIKDNGHLPGIPSAADVKSNGIELGDMNAKLLKKIEEMTLYLIDLKKDNLLLNERLKKLENK